MDDRLMEAALFNVGDLIDNQFRVNTKLGRGGYGEIYSCVNVNTGEQVAVKVERSPTPGILKEEELVLRGLQGCKYTPSVLHSGRHDGKINYIAMKLLGEDLSSLRNKQPTRTFSLLTTLMLARQMLRCIREVHERGFIHRDIKPGNFMIGTKLSGHPRTVTIIDYGLSREHLYDDGKPKTERKDVSWVGSRRYMSLNAHLRKDQGRRDDLWSLLYVLIEFKTGCLPWSHVEDLDKLREIKQDYDNEWLLYGLPKEFLWMMAYLKSLQYASCPDYNYLDFLIACCFVKHGGFFFFFFCSSFVFQIKFVRKNYFFPFS
eukprot:TRINITY_DN1863_c0_g2_i12.p1 TRINITY_DN1863_c0_g2~~TRINITY_DN1863_c0_g2_i12.p1  ORF type:complete len:317 (-),score=50.83 TRINITY_DN1863_c0_g2_i12:835-1785(-)